ncbi:MAG: class I SAM-dependent methyltransferase [Muribaculaceae bacterium]|nr:class I SAM-dependent methyltransferase [Muribaculaceae bacterium]
MHKVDLTCCPDFFTDSRFHEFVRLHAHDDSAALLLSSKYREEALTCGFPLDFATLQIDLRRKGQYKLPTFTNIPFTLFPSVVAYEQASNEYVARFHTSLLLSDDKNVLDMTAGLGIDTMSFAAAGCTVTACELDNYKASVLYYNASIIKPGNISVYNVDSIKMLTECKQIYDLIFVDPARRDANNKRKFAFSDCQPDIRQNLNTILLRTKRLLIKASPMLDITAILTQLPSVSHIYVVCFKGECKEILIEIIPEASDTLLSAVDINDKGDISEFSVNENHHNILYYTGELRKGMFLYEANAAIMKFGCWSALQYKFPTLEKLAPNTHLFCSNQYITDFPGRCVRIKKRFTKQERRALTDTPLNIVTRNYPVNAEKLKSQLQLKNGGKDFLYAFRSLSEPHGCLYLCEPT